LFYGWVKKKRNEFPLFGIDLWRKWKWHSFSKRKDNGMDRA